VPVQRHRAGAEYLRDPSHADRVCSLGVGDGDGSVDDLAARQRRCDPAPPALVAAALPAAALVPAAPRAVLVAAALFPAVLVAAALFPAVLVAAALVTILLVAAALVTILLVAAALVTISLVAAAPAAGGLLAGLQRPGALMQEAVRPVGMRGGLWPERGPEVVRVLHPLVHLLIHPVRVRSGVPVSQVPLVLDMTLVHRTS
jgi:hypothetical protein